MNRTTYTDFRRKSPGIHKAQYRKNWSMVFEDRRRSTKREQKEKAELKDICRTFPDGGSCRCF